MFYDILHTVKYTFHVKNQLFVTTKSGRIWIRNEVKSCIRIRTMRIRHTGVMLRKTWSSYCSSSMLCPLLVFYALFLQLYHFSLLRASKLDFISRIRHCSPKNFMATKFWLKLMKAIKISKDFEPPVFHTQAFTISFQKQYIEGQQLKLVIIYITQLI
jgi:hypothetical protein